MNCDIKRNKYSADSFRETPFSIKNENCELILSKVVKEDDFLDINKYPDMNYIQKKFCKHLNVQNDQLIFGHGSDDILKNLVLSLNYNSIQLLDPSYKMMEFYNKLLHKSIYLNGFRYDGNFHLNKEFKDVGGEVLYIANPHCPTAYKLNPDEIVRLSYHFKYIIVDEAYTNPLYIDNRYLNVKNIILVNTFSKLGGSAGLRIGYCVCSDQNVMEGMRSISTNYSLNSEAIRYLDLLLNNINYIENSELELKRGYEYLCEKINKRSFYAANFALFEYDDRLKEIGVEYMIDFKKFLRITLTNKNVFQKII